MNKSFNDKLMFVKERKTALSNEMMKFSRNSNHKNIQNE